MNGTTSKVANLDFQDFEIPSWPILIPFFQPFVTNCNESEWDHVAGKPYSCTLQLLRGSYSAEANSLFHQVRLSAFVHYAVRFSSNHLSYFMLPKCLYFVKNKIASFLCFSKLFLFLSLQFPSSWNPRDVLYETRNPKFGIPNFHYVFVCPNS